MSRDNSAAATVCRTSMSTQHSCVWSAVRNFTRIRYSGSDVLITPKSAVNFRSCSMAVIVRLRERFEKPDRYPLRCKRGFPSCNAQFSCMIGSKMWVLHSSHQRHRLSKRLVFRRLDNRESLKKLIVYMCAYLLECAY